MDSTTHTVDHNLIVTLHMDMNTLPIHNYMNTLALGMDILPPAGVLCLVGFHHHQPFMITKYYRCRRLRHFPSNHNFHKLMLTLHKDITSLDDYLNTIHNYMITKYYGRRRRRHHFPSNHNFHNLMLTLHKDITTLDDYLHTIHYYMNTLAFGILRMDILPHAAVLFLCLIGCNHHDPFMTTKHHRGCRLPLNHQVNLGHPSKTKRTLQWKSQSNCF